MKTNYKNFYEKEARGTGSVKDLAAANFDIINFIKKFGLSKKRVLEIGSGNGMCQDVVEDYTGIDVAESLSKSYHKPYFIIEDGKKYPFKDEYFDAIFTRVTFEHIPDINFALKEMLRVVKKGGFILFNMAWWVRPWVSKGLGVRPYRELNWKEKVSKCSIPVRENLVFRASWIFPLRLFHIIQFLINKKNFKNNLRLQKLEPNYELFSPESFVDYGGDSDACNSVDPHSMILYFMANNCKIINYSSLLRAFSVGYATLIIKKL